jgi:hypothetical protein
MIQFSQRNALIREAQTILGLKPDGIDGQLTWHALGTRFLPPNHPAMRQLLPTPARMPRPARIAVVAAVQAALGASVDGDDGPETWGAIMEGLAPLPVVQKSPHAVEAGYSEVIRGRSPNRNAGTNECKMIIVHHCAGTFEGTISWCLRPKTYAAYHCLVGQDGSRAILGRDTDRLHHAGRSSWRGRSGCNAFALGISVTGNTVTGARRPHRELTSDELRSTCEWITAKQKLYGIPNSEITTHWQVSPGRKDDISKAPAWEQIRAVLGLPA